MSMTFLLSIGAVGLVLVLYESIVLVLGLKKTGRLTKTDSIDQSNLPLVSIIVPACNEEKTIESGVRSFLQQDYINLEIIIIDDRSVDKTFEKVLALQQQNPQLSIHRITKLPNGWLGKSHALQYGASLASGEYLLFTDADILFAKSTVSSAVAYMKKNETDHLCLFFRNISSGWFLDSLILDGFANLLLLFRPWKVSDPRSKYFAGVGAFNMVRSEVYEEISGHSTIKMHPIDDIMLGKLIKRKGRSQQCLLALDFVSVHWYESVSQMMHGLMKNLFSLFHYRISLAVCMALISIVVHIVPLWGAFFSSGFVRILFVIIVIVRLASYLCVQQIFKVSPWCVPGSLLSPYFNIYTLIRSICITVKNKGIVWRGTFYPLSELKKSEPILF